MKLQPRDTKTIHILVLFWCKISGHPVKTALGSQTLCDILSAHLRKNPYQAVYGRTPAMLPDLTLTQEDATGEQQQRVRTIAINNMIQTTAMARIGRSLSTKTQHGVEQSGIRENDLVDVYRKPSSKDVSGWKGPYKVTKLEPERGQVIVSMKPRPAESHRRCSTHPVRDGVLHHLV